MEDTDLFKKVKVYNEKSRKEEEQKREEIIEKENSDPFRKITEQAKFWIQKYLRLSGIQRNKYSQIVDKFKRLSISQISGIMLEVHGYHVSPEMIGKYKRFLITEGLLKTDREIEERRPNELELKEIRRKGARHLALERSKQKSHPDTEELNQVLKRKEVSEDIHIKMRKLKEDIEEHGYYPNDSEERELEEYEENQEEDI